MASSELVTTEYLVLRKTPYSETSLVVAGLSPDHGQLHFLVRGERKLGRRSFPTVDLFRHLRVQFREGRGELHSWKSVDLVADHAGLGRSVKAFTEACRLGQFVLANAFAGISHVRLFEALLVALGRLSNPDPLSSEDLAGLCDACACGIGLVFLDEHGLLSDYAHDERAATQCARILAMAAGTAPVPGLRPENWHKIRRWTEGLLHLAECRLPDD